MLRTLIWVSLIAMIGLGTAYAQKSVEDRVPDDGAMDTDEEIIVRPNDGRDVDAPVLGWDSRLYGWRPANCGVFRYWNGEACVDARVTPAPQ